MCVNAIHTLLLTMTAQEMAEFAADAPTLRVACACTSTFEASVETPFSTREAPAHSMKTQHNHTENEPLQDVLGARGSVVCPGDGEGRAVVDHQPSVGSHIRNSAARGRVVDIECTVDGSCASLRWPCLVSERRKATRSEETKAERQQRMRTSTTLAPVSTVSAGGQVDLVLRTSETELLALNSSVDAAAEACELAVSLRANYEQFRANLAKSVQP